MNSQRQDRLDHRLEDALCRRRVKAALVSERARCAHACLSTDLRAADDWGDGFCD